MSFNYTFRVPSIEHAAEAIGKEGFKIKEIQLMTKASIVPPKPGSDPVFVIKAPSSEALYDCCDYLQKSCNHFDKIRLEKRNIIVPRCGVICTVRVLKEEVNKIIGSKGSTVQEIEKVFEVNIKSPDRSTPIASKQPIFVISGLEENVNNCRAFIKLLLYKSKHPLQMTLYEFQIIEPLLNDHLKSIIDLKSIKKILKKERFFKNVEPKLDLEKFYCPLCYTVNAKAAKAFPCGHFVACENCIVKLFRNPVGKCTNEECRCKIDQFELLIHQKLNK